MAEDPISLKDYSEILRNMVRHEDELTNQRLTWMSTLNGLLFTGVGFIWGKPHDQIVIMAFCVLGVVISFSAYLSLRTAEDARYELYLLWKEKAISKSSIPPVAGWVKTSPVLRFFFPWNVLPWALVLTWIVLLIVNCVRSA